MKENGFVGVLVLVIVILIGGLLAGWYFIFLQPKMQFEKARKPDTSLKTVSESSIPRTKIRESGFNVEITIEPSQNDTISGEVTIAAADVPAEAKHVGFSISENFEDLGTGGPNLGFDSSETEGWTKTLDTTKYKNGKYFVALFVFSTDASSNPIGTANVQVEISN
jgi:hypothetical protein